MQACLSEALTMPCTFAQDVALSADAGAKALETWLPKLERHLEEQGLDRTRTLLRERGIELVAASFQGGLLLSQGEQRQAHFDHFRQRLQICQELRIPTLVLAADFTDTIDPIGLERALVSLKQAGQWAAAFDVRLALEFQARNPFCSCLETAWALVQQCGEENVGLCLDLFHYYTGPSKLEDLALVDPARLLHVQACDLSGVPRETATDADRILPGDGDFRLDSIWSTLRNMGYQGWVALEAMNPMLWQANPQQVAEVALTALRKSLGLATM